MKDKTFEELSSAAKKNVKRIIKSSKPENTDPLKDATKLLLDRIISWEKDLSEYGTLESILRSQFIIIERTRDAYHLIYNPSPPSEQKPNEGPNSAHGFTEGSDIPEDYYLK